MPFARPTLAELVARIQQDFVSRMELQGAVLRRSVVHVLSRVQAGAVHMLHGHLEYLGVQLFADTSDREFLLRQASLYGLTPTPADFAKGTVQVVGSNGSVLPAGAVLLRSDGAEYTTDADATAAGGVAVAQVTAALAGAAGTLLPGVALTVQSPVSGLAASATVTASTQDGSDEESTGGLRARLLERQRKQPQGGAEADYVAWAKEVPGVTRVWVTPKGLGVGTVVLRFVRDNDAGLIPSPTEVAAVQAYVDERRPVTAAVTVLAPTEAPLPLTLVVKPDTVAVRAAVEAEVRDVLQRTASPGGTVLLSSLRTAIGVASGLTDYVLVSPVADFTPPAGDLPVLGNIQWT